MSRYFDKEDMAEHVETLKKMEVGDDDFRMLGSKIICSYSKPYTLTEKGFERGLKMWDKYISGDSLDRKELFDLILLGVEAALFYDKPNYMDVSRKAHIELSEKYHPEDEYMENLISIYVSEGFYKPNDDFIQLLYNKINVMISNNTSLRDIFITFSVGNNDEFIP